MIDSPELTVSVVVCAYSTERWPGTLAALASIRRQSRPPLETILVIDHNPALLDRARAVVHDVQVIESSHARGVAGARNSGVECARGALIAFLDDDAVAEPDWLAWLCQPFVDPRVLGTGGLLQPVWVTGRPAWFPEEFLWVVGCSYRGLPTGPAEVRNPIGASLCLRRAVFESVGGFADGFGRVGLHPVGCEETELALRAHRHWPGGTFFFEPRSVVMHTVPPGRADWRYFVARCYFEGISKGQLAQRYGAGEGLSAERRYVRQTLLGAIGRNLAAALTRGDRSALARTAAIAGGLILTTAGYLWGRSQGSPLAGG